MKTALGKGLDALIPGGSNQEIIEIDLTRITTGPEQPRKVFSDDALKELAASIKAKGVLQPVLVRREPGGSFRLIAGERRYRAAGMAGLRKVPAVVRDADDSESAELALIENIQREDLNPVETAEAFDRLINKHKLTQEQLSDVVGKDRATVANYLRLLALPKEVKDMLSAGLLSMGHARAILAIEGDAARLRAAKSVVAGGLSVRATEQLARGGPADKADKPKAAPIKRDADVVALEEKLIKHLGTKVKLKHKGKKGSITIEYYSLEELDRLLEVLLD